MRGIFVQVAYLHHLVSFSEGIREDLATQINGWTEQARGEFAAKLASRATSSEYSDIAAYHYFDSIEVVVELAKEYGARDQEIQVANQSRHDALVEEARRTGKPVVLRRWMEPDEEDGFYYHTEVMTPEGKIETRTVRGY